MRTRADLTGLPGFNRLAVDTSGNPCVWRNLYSCQCPDGPQCDWEMEWSCQCDDECPACGADCAPYGSIWLGPDTADQWNRWRTLPEADRLDDPSSVAGRRLCAGADDAAASPRTDPGRLP